MPHEVSVHRLSGEKEGVPTFLQGDSSELEGRTVRLEKLVSTGHRGTKDVARLVTEYLDGAAG